MLQSLRLQASMNNAFQISYERLLAGKIGHLEFVEKLKGIGDFSDDLLIAIHEQIKSGNHEILSWLVHLIHLVNSPKFAMVLSELLDNHRDDGYMEEVATLMVEIKDPRTVPSIIRALDLDFGAADCDHHFNRWLVKALDRMGTPEALEGLSLAAQSPFDLVRKEAEKCLNRRSDDQVL